MGFKKLAKLLSVVLFPLPTNLCYLYWHLSESPLFQLHIVGSCRSLFVIIKQLKIHPSYSQTAAT